jgi:uncharacterized phage protein gp47/JayE
VPLPISNAPGLSAIHYRIGTFTSFRRAMLDMIALPDLLASAFTTLDQDNITSISVQASDGFPFSPPFRIKVKDEYMLVTDGAGSKTWTVQGRGASPSPHSQGDPVILDPVNPFLNWHEGIDSDYQTALIELWAYLADILTFYQERIANEAFLGTAQLRDSLLRLVTLINYRPSPGAGASGLAAFTVAKDQQIVVPEGFRVGSRPKPGKLGVVFETKRTVSATGDNSLIPLSVVSPDAPFPSNTLIFQGANNRLEPNDFFLVIEPSKAIRVLLRIATVNVDQSGKTTAITWLHDPLYNQASKQAQVYAFRVVAAPFGINAPAYSTLSQVLTPVSANASPPRSTVPYPENWDDPAMPSFFIPTPPVSASSDPASKDGDPRNTLFLDSVYSQLKFNVTNPGWAILLTDEVPQILRVIDSRTAAKTAYSISSKATRLTFDADISPGFPLRNTVVLTGSERLALQQNVALSPVLPDPQVQDTVLSKRLVLAGIHTQLLSGQTALLKGNRFDPSAGSAVGDLAVESCVIDGPPVPDFQNHVTQVKLKDSLANRYVRASCFLLGNICEVTQGETIKDEILGNGDASAFQSFPLKKKPLTYQPSTDPEGLAAVKSVLTVTVNGVAWTEQPNLAASAPHDQDFTTALDDSDQTTVIFGDGFNGARTPKGVNNIHARYRKGLGASGNLPSDSIQQLIDSLPNLQKVTNPGPSSGGADPESLDKIRAQAPASLQTFSRAVSTADYSALARSFPGVAKASAAWIVQDPVTLQAIPHPYLQLTLATLNQVPMAGTILASNLRRFLDNHRDPNVPLRLQDSSPVYIEVVVQVEIDSRFPHQATLNSVLSALNPGINPDGSAGYFAFESLQFGQSIYLSAVYAAVQSIAGVKDATITSLRRVGPGAAEDPAIAPHDIVICPTEIVTIANDPQNPAKGRLFVTGQGGFVDT